MDHSDPVSADDSIINMERSLRDMLASGDEESHAANELSQVTDEVWATVAPPSIWWQRTKSSSIYLHTYVSSTSKLMCFLMCILLCSILGIDCVIELCCYRGLTLEKQL